MISSPRSHAVIVARETPFYYAVEVDRSIGFVIEKQGDTHYMTELGNHDGVSF